MELSTNRNPAYPDPFFFVGRETFLHTLRSTLLANRKAVLTGTRGVGKTAIARAYIQRFSHEYQSICWLNMATDETLLADLLSTLQMLSLPTTTILGVSGLFQTLQTYLFTHQDFLMVLDNLPASFKFQQQPAQPPITSHLLVIPHSHATPLEAPQLEVPVLEEQAGALLVLRRAGMLTAQATLEQAEEEQRLAALELARTLHGQPIALTLAGSYLHETNSNLQDYLLAFRNTSPRLHLPDSAENKDLQTIAAACELSLTHLQQTQPTTLELLQIGALLLPEAFPATLFQQQPNTTEETSATHQDALPILLTSGLLTPEQTAPLAVSMHSLVQELVRQFFALDTPQQQGEQALQLFQRLLPSLQAEPVAARLRIAGHIRHLAQFSEQWSPSSNPAAEVFSWAASLLCEQGLINTAEPLLKQALAIWEGTLGSADPKVAAILDNLATLNGLLKNYAEAEALAHRAIASKAAALGVNHPDVLLALDHLGHIYAAQGKHQEAQSCYEKALAIGEQVGLRQHPIQSAITYDLALLLLEQQHYAQAEPLLQQVCLVWGRVLDPEDPSTMAARFSLAEVSGQLQNWKRADTCYRQALPICERLLGVEHPVTLGHLQRAAMVYLQLGNYAEARLNLQRVLAIRERTLSLQHPDVAACLNGLAQVALAQEQYPEAQALLERAEGIYTNQPEPDNLALATILDTLAAIEAAQHHAEQAIAASQRALELRRQILGEEHPGLVENLNQLAAYYLVQAKARQAEPLLLQALFIYQQAQKADDLTLDPILSYLAEIEIARGHVEMARMYLERVRSLREMALERSDPRLAEIFQKLTEVSNAQIWL